MARTDGDSPRAVDLEALARLAGVTLTGAERAAFPAQLAQIAEHFARLEAVEPLEGVPGDAGVTCPLREDRSEEWRGSQQILASAPAVKDRHFLIPPGRREK